MRGSAGGSGQTCVAGCLSGAVTGGVVVQAPANSSVPSAMPPVHTCHVLNVVCIRTPVAP